MKLWYPYNAATSVVRVPRINTDVVTSSVTSVIVKHSEDGSKRSYIKNSTFKALDFNLKSVSNVKLEELRTFFLAAQGHAIGYEDRDGQSWKCYVPHDLAFITTGRGLGTDDSPEAHTLQLSLKGFEK